MLEESCCLPHQSLFHEQCSSIVNCQLISAIRPRDPPCLREQHGSVTTSRESCSNPRDISAAPASLESTFPLPIMPWFSILPANLTIVETWISGFFVSPPPLPKISLLTIPPTAPPRHHDPWPLGPLPHLRPDPLPHPRRRLRDPLLWRPNTRQTTASCA